MVSHLVLFFLLHLLSHLHLHLYSHHFVDATEYLSFSGYDPSIQLNFSTPLLVPSSIATTTGIRTVSETILYRLAQFGGNVISPANRSSETVEVVLASPLSACQDLRHPHIANATKEQIKQYYQGKIILTQHGDCSYAIQAAMCERQGALLHLVTLPPDEPNREFASVHGSSTEDALDLPTGMINYEDGYILYQSMLANPNVTVTGTLQTTGPCDVSDVAALVRLFRQMNVTISRKRPFEDWVNYWFWYGADQEAQGIWNPLLLLNDKTFDPCLHRIWNIGCAGGRITRVDHNSFDLASDITWDMFSPFTGLQFLDLSYNGNIAGPMPCEWGSFSQLKFLVLGSNSALTSFTECCAGMKSLEFVLAGFTSINNLPKCLTQLQNIRTISFDSAKISAPMIDIRNWTKLEFFDFNGNNITGSFPNLSHARATLQKFFMTDTQLTGEIPIDTFDHMPMLLKVDIGRNNLSGVLPSFYKTNEVVDLGLDHNNFVGGIPSTWFMPSLIALRGGHNHLTGSLEPLFNFTSMKSVDLSYNELSIPHVERSEYEQTLHDWTDVTRYLSDCLPIGIEIIQLSHNKINGTWFKRNFRYQSNITHLYLSHNLITGWDNTQTFLFVAGTVSKVTVIDFSFNPLLAGSLAPVGPTPVLQVLKLNGCPLLRDIYSNPPALPSYLQADMKQFTKNSADEKYLCPGVEGRYYPLQVYLDPSYYGYTGCICDQGTYGTPPNCLTIPLQANTTADPITVSGSITDEVYGSSRMSIGIDIAWAIGSIDALTHNVSTVKNITTTQNVTVVNPITNSTSTELVNVTSTINSSETVIIGASLGHTLAIYITITFQSTFNDYFDIIDLYAGRTIRGLPVVSVRGSDERPFPSNQQDVIAAITRTGTKSGIPSNTSTSTSTSASTTTTYVIFASYATLNFRSRKTSGQQFIANYTLSDVCPTGWKATGMSTPTCALTRPIYVLPEAVTSVVYAVSAVVLFCIVLSLVVLLLHRRKIVFRAASVHFCCSILIFAAILSIGSMLYVLSPGEHPHVCQARIWLSTLSLVGLLGFLLTKANRIRHLFTNTDLKAVKHAAKRRVVIRSLVIMLGIQIILLVALSTADLTHSQMRAGEKSTAGYDVYSCTSVETHSYQAWLVMQLTYIGIHLVMGVYIAFSIRNVPSAFNESSHIVNSLYILSLLSIILLPLNFIVDDNPAALAVIRGLGQNLVALSMTAAIFGRKFYYLWEGRADDRSMVDGMLSSTPFHTGERSRDHMHIHGRALLGAVPTATATATAAGTSHSPAPVPMAGKRHSSTSECEADHDKATIAVNVADTRLLNAAPSQRSSNSSVVAPAPAPAPATASVPVPVPVPAPDSASASTQAWISPDEAEKSNGNIDTVWMSLTAAQVRWLQQMPTTFTSSSSSNSIIQPVDSNSTIVMQHSPHPRTLPPLRTNVE